MEKSDEIKIIVSKMYDAIAKGGDPSFIENAFSKKDEALLIGTDPNEWFSGYSKITEMLNKQLEEMGSSKIIKSNPQAYSKGNMGWVADQAVFKIGEFEFPMRLTGVLEKEDEGWKIIQWHASIGVPNQEALGKELPLE